MIEGSIFGETDLLKNRIRSESYTTVTDCYLLQIPKALFKEVLSEFDDFRLEVEAISKQREWMRLARIQAWKLGVDEETFLGQHAIDKNNVAIMEERLEIEEESVLGDDVMDEKLALEKRQRMKKIEVLFTLRESHHLGIHDAIMRNSPLIGSRLQSTETVTLNLA